MMQRKLCLREGVTLAMIIGAATIPTLPVSAQSAVRSNVPSSTMESLARVVVETNPEIAAQRHQVKIAKARLQAAEAAADR
jgi:outer membrane protein